MGTKVSELDQDDNPTLDDLLYAVNAPGGTPQSKRITIEALRVLLGAVRPCAKMTRDAAQTLDNATNEIIEFDDTEYAVGITATEGASARFVIEEAGKYIVTASIKVPGLDDGNSLLLVIRVNGGGTTQTAIKASGTDQALGQVITDVFDLEVDDYVEFLVNQQSGDPQDTFTTAYEKPRMSVSMLTGVGDVAVTNPENLLINGCMRVSQRNIAVATEQANQDYSLDRWIWGQPAGSGVATVQQSTDGPTGTPFKKCLRVDVTTADVALAVDAQYLLSQRIEAQNLQHLLYGNAAAKTLALSFWVKSNLTGNFGAKMYTADGTSRSCPLGYTINAVDTWELKTIQIAGDASATIDNDSGNGLELGISLGVGTDRSNGVKDTWDDTGTTPNVKAIDSSWNTNVLSSTDNYLCITGVQLEVGSVAGEFESLPFDEVVRRCQRYYYKTYEIATAPGTDTQTGQLCFETGRAISDDAYVRQSFRYAQELRGTCVTTLYAKDGTSGSMQVAGTNRAALVSGGDAIGFETYQNKSGVEWGATADIKFHITADAEL